MTTMNISLPEEMKAFIEAQLSEEGYASASEYFRALVREAQRRKDKAKLDALLMEGLENPLPLSEITKEFWDEIEREVLEELKGEDIRP